MRLSQPVTRNWPHVAALPLTDWLQLAVAPVMLYGVPRRSITSSVRAIGDIDRQRRSIEPLELCPVRTGVVPTCCKIRFAESMIGRGRTFQIASGVVGIAQHQKLLDLELASQGGGRINRRRWRRGCSYSCGECPRRRARRRVGREQYYWQPLQRHGAEVDALASRRERAWLQREFARAADAQYGVCRVSRLGGLLHGIGLVAHGLVVRPALVVVERVGPAGDGLGSDRHTGLHHVRGEGAKRGGNADEDERAEARSALLRL
eukprot:scaffold4443_cov69-Phaeocystis_antarctica.AAC.1